MIDLADCDTMLPSVFDIRPNLDFDEKRRPYLFNSALISLSILLGRILKAVYSPSTFQAPCAARRRKCGRQADGTCAQPASCFSPKSTPRRSSRILRRELRSPFRFARSLTSALVNSWVGGLPEELRFQGPAKSTPEQGQYVRLR